jgi:hypothetical protein
MTENCHTPVATLLPHQPETAVSYLVVTHLDLSACPAGDRRTTEQRLAALGLLRSLVDARLDTHVLPDGTYAGVFSGATAHALRDRMVAQVRAALGPAARVAVCVGRHAGV